MAAITAECANQAGRRYLLRNQGYGTYRHMEDLADPKVHSWIKAQNGYARTTLASLPGRQQRLKRIVELDESTADIARVRLLPGDVYLYTKLVAGEDTHKLYLRQGLRGTEKLLVDPERIVIAEASRAKGSHGSGEITSNIARVGAGGGEHVA